MKDFEEKLRQAMGAGAGYDAGKEETLREVLTEGFRGMNRWLSVLAWGYAAIFIGMAIGCAVMFFRSSSERDWIMYAALFVVMNADLVLVKLWFWQRWSRNSVVREVKRMELNLLKVLSEKIK